ncbi:pyridoxamine 5'-phosphate oxidase family protein [Aspergillus tanneri]|uniref:Pyridoxamine 5'-phosphate oxidase N-terminal domain-containing protein n=1 Tax=Aspergillus tanneri TaxID=1220188 RepID=A0A5M9N0Z0_9EURO|nr:uncharacterized protein ATNIH1004_000155 [Aspergillus tanneri]KAA8651274.1 hypothetical protein ATNIH1004_000155 [Aspergillus tanneri]
MVKYYDSVSPDLIEWALNQSVFFVASAPRHGRHVNLSPKGLPDASFAILGPNQAAYVDATGSGNETISHLRENGRITVMFCSFDASPRILRFFCKGSVIEWNQPEFGPYMARMGGKNLPGARAIICLDIFKVQTSCGFGVPLLALTIDPETNTPKPYLKDRETLGHWAGKRVAAGQLHSYQKENNNSSLDGLPGLKSAVKDSGRSLWWSQIRNWIHQYRDEIDLVKTSVLIMIFALEVARWAGLFV